MKRSVPRLVVIAVGFASLLGPLAISNPASASEPSYRKAPLEWRTARQVQLTDQCVNWNSSNASPHAAAPYDDLTVIPYDSGSGDGCGLHLRDMGKVDVGSERVAATPKRAIDFALRHPRAGGCKYNANAPGVARCLHGIPIKKVKTVAWGRSQAQLTNSAVVFDGPTATYSYCNGVINPCYIAVTEDFTDIFGDAWTTVTEEAFYWDGTNVTGFVTYPAFYVDYIPNPPISLDSPSTALGAWPATHVYYTTTATFHCVIHTFVFGDIACGEFSNTNYIDALGNGYANAG